MCYHTSPRHAIKLGPLMSIAPLVGCTSNPILTRMAFDDVTGATDVQAFGPLNRAIEGTRGSAWTDRHKEGGQDVALAVSTASGRDLVRGGVQRLVDRRTAPLVY
jgi:hypothetical protein